MAGHLVSQTLTRQVIQPKIGSGAGNRLEIPTGVEYRVLDSSLLGEQPNLDGSQKLLKLDRFREKWVNPYCCGEPVKI